MVLMRWRAILRRLIAIALAVSMMPGLGELVENLEHLLHDGHLAHGEAHEAVAEVEQHAENTEHGCTPFSHHCGCHSNVPLILEDAVEVQTKFVWVPEKRPTHTEEHPPSRANAPPTPPLIA